MTASELMEKALPYRAFWGEDGGITLSGGEILLQPEFALEVFTKCKELGISTCLKPSAIVLGFSVSLHCQPHSDRNGCAGIEERQLFRP